VIRVCIVKLHSSVESAAREPPSQQYKDLKSREDFRSRIPVPIGVHKRRVNRTQKVFQQKSSVSVTQCLALIINKSVGVVVGTGGQRDCVYLQDWFPPMFTVEIRGERCEHSLLTRIVQYAWIWEDTPR
jgi:hypothetical protein